jgi:hypothetical protein
MLRLNASKIALCTFLAFSSSTAFAETARTLSSSDRAEIWRSLGKEATRTSVPAGLHVGEKVPNTMQVLSFAHRIRKRVPAIRSFSYALLQGQVLIIDPRTRKIVTIVDK